MVSRSLSVVALLRPHWRMLAVAFAAILVQGLADLLEPWPLKVSGERGDTLSGGQRQRIATIARAIIRDSPILLLDEPTAALDPASEELTLQGLEQLLQGRTSITIAHRLATVRRSDVIFVLDEGVIVERGTHAQLLAADGLYAELYRKQFRRDDRAVAVAAAV